MEKKVVWTPRAQLNLDAIMQFIAQGSTYYAYAYAKEIHRKGESLSQFSDRGKIVKEFDDPDLREIVVKNHRLIYLNTKTDVFVLAIVHHRQKLEM